MGHWRCCWRRMPVQCQATAMTATCAGVAPCPRGHPCAAVPRAANLPMIQLCSSPFVRACQGCGIFRLQWSGSGSTLLGVPHFCEPLNC